MKKELNRAPKQMCMPKEEYGCSTMQLAHSYVPWQVYDKAFSPQEALMKGTLFPELYGTYLPPK